MKEQLKKADILGLVLMAGALIAYSIRSAWSVYLTAAMVLGGILIVASVAVKFQDIRVGLGRRSTRFGINSATSVILFLGVLCLANYLGAQHPVHVDMTTEKFYTLSDDSARVAEQVTEDLSIKAFYPGGNEPRTLELLDRYKAKNSRISYEFIDPDKQPQLAQQYTVTSYGDLQNPMTGDTVRFGTLILEMAGKTERIEKPSQRVEEEDITNAVMRIVKGEKKTIYFVEGHGEKSSDDVDRTGYSIARGDLERQSYVVKKINLVQENQVPADASILIMAGPTSEPFANEVEALNAYLDKGGSGLILLDPNTNVSMKDFLSKWSVDVGNNLVLDASGMGRLIGMGPAAPLVTTYAPHAITERMRTMTFFPMSRSVTPAATPAAGATVETLLQTNENSWGETNVQGAEAEFNEGTDMKGPVTLAVAISKDAPDNKKARVVVYGDSDFASNAYFAQAGNGTIFTNTINWLAHDENFISIQPKSSQDRPLTMTEAQGRVVSYVFVLLLPVSVLAAGVSVWMKRRK